MRAEEQKQEEIFQKKESIYQGRVIDMGLEYYRFRGGIKKTEIVHHKGSVAILPITENREILFIKQWRRAVREIIIELPAGTLEKGEDPKVCAQRELQEECGYKAKTLEKMGSFFVAPGYSDEYLHLFLAKNLIPSTLEHDDDEGIDLFPLKLEDVAEYVEKNIIKDAKTIAALYYLLLKQPK